MRSRAEGVGGAAPVAKRALRSRTYAAGRRSIAEIDSPRHQLPLTETSRELAVFDDHLATQDGDHRPSLHRPSFPGAVVAHVKVLAREFAIDHRIDQHHVGVAARRDHALCVDRARGFLPRWSRSPARSVQGHPTFDDALGIDDSHPGFGAEIAAGDVFDCFSIKFDRERRREFVGGDGRHTVADQSVPQRPLIVRVLERGIGVIAEAARRAVVVSREAGIVMQRLGVRPPAPSARASATASTPSRAEVWTK